MNHVENSVRTIAKITAFATVPTIVLVWLAYYYIQTQKEERETPIEDSPLVNSGVLKVVPVDGQPTENKQ